MLFIRGNARSPEILPHHALNTSAQSRWCGRRLRARSCSACGSSPGRYRGRPKCHRHAVIGERRRVADEHPAPAGGVADSDDSFAHQALWASSLASRLQLNQVEISISLHVRSATLEVTARPWHQPFRHRHQRRHFCKRNTHCPKSSTGEWSNS
jgi:hypothetical protein